MVPRHGALKQGGKVAIPLTLIAAPPPLKPGSHRHTRSATVPYAQVGVGALLLVAFAVPVLLVFVPVTLPPESASAATLVLALMLVTFVAVMLEALS